MDWRGHTAAALVLIVCAHGLTLASAANSTEVSTTEMPYLSSTSSSTVPITDAATIPTTNNVNPSSTDNPGCRSGIHTSNGECCEECAPGFGVYKQCSANTTENTICTVCSPEVTFSAVLNHLAACQTCRRCGQNEVLTSPCQIMQDTVCECAANYFRNDDTQGDGAQGVSGGGGGIQSTACSQCMICPPGFGATAPCSPHQNSVCEQCSNGTYSDVISSTERCMPCSACGEGSSVIKPCSRFSDTVCLDFVLPTVTYKTKGNGASTTSWVHATNVGSSGFSVVPIFCTLLGMVIFGLLAYVIFKKWSFKKVKLRQTQQKMTRSSSCHTDVEANTISILSLTKNGPTFHSRDSALDRSGSATICRQPLLAVPSQTPYQQLPADKRAEVEKTLSVTRIDGHDWRGLARELGFTDVDIVRIAQCTPATASPARAMLDEWQFKNSKHAFCGTLVDALRRIRRHDVAEILPVFTYSAYHFPS